MSNASQAVKDIGSAAINTATLGQTNISSAERRRTQQASQDFGITPPPQPGDTNPTPVTPMPIPGQDDLANIAARRKSIEQQLFRRGRLSTILSNPLSEPLGG